MPKNKSSISEAKSYEEIAEFWDEHDLTDYWDKTKEVTFDVEIETERIYYGIDNKLAEEIEALAKHRGISGDTLVNMWIQEKLLQGNPD
ncbi:hypothetical protein GWO43_01870 [candidate division KSB1 bacterium]|nr:hypothetical protein [candidate division KSB1 bacterium]NIR69472.1 hypothetical protein [candidate division KSB1 bacterium]NIS22822.1 hypothetical protein [candidate division KSB1 bacterium]NIT69662.1 hypothetical protein [candidate division KSB1 bacterium]NIU23331.1 hypothetical protein [candidate division KSB1 bacterium]